MIETATLWQLIEARADATPDAILAIDGDGREMDFRKYRDECLRTARGLVGLGVGPGRVVCAAAGRVRAAGSRERQI